MTCSDPRAAEIRDFWLTEIGPKGWYFGGEALDDTIRARFEALWHEARRGDLMDWLNDPVDVLSFLILTDQFPRNMFRGDARSFASDGLARAVTKSALRRGFDLRVEGSARQFYYLPLEHSESIADQCRAVRLVLLRMTESPTMLVHARAHREIIRRFGRFPFRNEALGRKTSDLEAEFLEAGAYGEVVRQLQAGEGATPE